MRDGRRILTEDAGFSMIEVLTSMVIGSIVLTALMMVFIKGINFSASAQDRVQANQQGRSAMDSMTQLLDSGTCMLIPAPNGSGDVASVSPIVAGDANSVTFYADLSGASSAPDKYRLVYDPAARTLTQYRYDGTGAEPNVVFATTPSRKILLAESVLPARNDANAQLPIFTYYTFPASSGGPPVAVPSPLTTPQTVVEVVVSFQPVPRRTGVEDARHSNSLSGQSIVQTADPGTKTVCP